MGRRARCQARYRARYRARCQARCRLRCRVRYHGGCAGSSDHVDRHMSVCWACVGLTVCGRGWLCRLSWLSGLSWLFWPFLAVFGRLVSRAKQKNRKCGQHQNSDLRRAAHKSATRVTGPIQAQTTLYCVVLQSPTCGASGVASVTSRTLLGLDRKVPRGVERTVVFAVLAAGLVSVTAFSACGRFMARATRQKAAGEGCGGRFRSVRPAPHNIGDPLYSKASAAHELRHGCVLPLKTQRAPLSEHTILA